MPTEADEPVGTERAQATTLAHRVAGSAAGRDLPTVVLVHGFAQTGECLGPLGVALESSRRVVRVDQPGHGASLRHRDASMDDGARLLTRTAGRGVYVGYSMGARLCLTAATLDAEAVEALVLIGGTAGIADGAERDERRRADAALADHLDDVGLDRFLEEWLALPMFAGLPGWARFDEERRRNTAEGLSASLRRAGTGAMTPLWHRLERIRCPVLCVTGGLDERYGSLAEQIVSGVTRSARHEVIAGAGHAAHLEAPDATIAAVQRFLDALPT